MFIRNKSARKGHVTLTHSVTNTHSLSHTQTAGQLRVADSQQLGPWQQMNRRSVSSRVRVLTLRVDTQYTSCLTFIHIVTLKRRKNSNTVLCINLILQHFQGQQGQIFRGCCVIFIPKQWFHLCAYLEEQVTFYGTRQKQKHCLKLAPTTKFSA